MKKSGIVTTTSHISISSIDKINLISNLFTLLLAGIPILETVNSLLEGAKGNQRKLLETLKEDLMQGQHVYYTFAKFPNIFDKVTINIIKASEEAGTLDVTLQNLKDTIRKQVEFTDKIKSALIYPSFIIVVFFGVLLVILVIVVPKISTVFLRLNVELPLPTVILIYLSNVVINYTLPLIAGIAVLGAASYYGYNHSKRAFLGALFSFPGISQLVREIDLVNFSRNMALLLSAGIPITNALELTKDVVVKKDVAKVLESTNEMVLSGKKMSEGLMLGKNVIPSIVVKIIEAGEKSGTLEKSMMDVSEFLDYQISGTLKNLTALIEPVMLVVVGLLMGGMMLAIIAPIYGLIGQVGSAGR